MPSRDSLRPGSPLRWLCVVALAAAALPAHAAGLQVSPILLQFRPQDRSLALWLSNTGSQPLRAQVRVRQWLQRDQADVLEPASDMAASPPLVEVAPGERQLVRIVRLDESVPGGERSYRLLIDELPAPPAEDAQGRGLQLLLRYSVPVFHGGDSQKPTSAEILRTLTGSWVGGPQPQLVLANAGTRRVRIAQLVHEDAQGRRTVLIAGLAGYVLTGQRMRWDLPASAATLGPGTVKAVLNDDPQEQTLPLGREAL